MPSGALSLVNTASARPGPRPTDPGYLYVIHHPGYPAHSKIGRAVDPERRLAAANTWSPAGRFRLIGAVHFTDAHQAERIAHHLLGPKWVRGEWFRVWPREALNFLRGLKRRFTNRKDNDV